jgi:AMP-binding enzyme/Acetyl-coenzyme A synthetase N-terminus
MLLPAAPVVVLSCALLFLVVAVVSATAAAAFVVPTPWTAAEAMAAAAAASSSCSKSKSRVGGGSSWARTSALRGGSANGDDLHEASSSSSTSLLSPKDHNNSDKCDGSSSTSNSIISAKTNSALDRYRKEYAQSVQDPTAFWGKKAMEFLDWDRPFTSVIQGSFRAGGTAESDDVRWFENGKLNVCYNAVDRHVLAGRGPQTALLWEGDEPGDVQAITYSQLQTRVCQIASALQASGVQRGDVVTLYMPMIPDLPATMLACARIGAAHSVVFAGFSAEALAQRIVAAQSKVVVTATVGYRGGKVINLKEIVDAARTKENSNAVVDQVLVWERIGDGDIIPDLPAYEMTDKDVRMEELVRKQRPYCPVEAMDAEGE